MKKEIYSANVTITDGNRNITVEQYPISVNDGKTHWDDRKLQSVLKLAKIADKDKDKFKLKNIELIRKIGL